MPAPAGSCDTNVQRIRAPLMPESNTQAVEEASVGVVDSMTMMPRTSSLVVGAS